MSQVVDEVLAANKNMRRALAPRRTWHSPPARGFAILTCMDARSIRRNTPVYLKVTPRSLEMPVGARPTMPFALSSSRTNCWEPASGLSSTTPTVVWSYSQTT